MINEFTEVDESDEGGSDFSLSLEDFADLYVIPGDWSVLTLIDSIDRMINLDPEFQRRSVWSKTAKSKFIESLALGVPIPQILLAEDSSNPRQYIVLDGKQRLLTIKEFIYGAYSEGEPFKLSGLTHLGQLNGLSWEEVQLRHPDIARQIQQSFIRTAVIRGWRREDVLYEIFHRLNSGSVRLSPMELRMSLIRGGYIKYVIAKTSQLQELQQLLGLKYPDKRMKDVEIAIRFFAFHNRRIEYAGNLKTFLDDHCNLMNKIGPDGYKDSFFVFEESIRAGLSIFDGKKFARKYLPKENQFESRFNRAIFDVLAESLTSEEVREASLAKPERFIASYKKVCENTEFIRSVETTTKTTDATRKRFQIWFDHIQEEFGVPLKMPNLKDDSN